MIHLHLFQIVNFHRYDKFSEGHLTNIPLIQISIPVNYMVGNGYRPFNYQRLIIPCLLTFSILTVPALSSGSSLSNSAKRTRSCDAQDTLHPFSLAIWYYIYIYILYLSISIIYLKMTVWFMIPQYYTETWKSLESPAMMSPFLVGSTIVHKTDILTIFGMNHCTLRVYLVRSLRIFNYVQICSESYIQMCHSQTMGCGLWRIHHRMIPVYREHLGRKPWFHMV